MEHDGADLLALGGPGLTPLLPFTADASEERVRTALRSLAKIQDVDRRVDLQAALVVFAERVFPEGGWARLVPEEVVVKSELFERAKELSAAAARAEMVLRLVRARLGRSASRWGRRVSAADTRTLEALFDALIDTTDRAAALEALERLLGQPAPARSRRSTPKRPKRSSRA